MDKYSEHNSAAPRLYPEIAPYDQRRLNVGDGHQVYVEQCGNPQGMPVVVVHGGPGGGCSAMMRRFFDPERYRVVLFDQRGCGRSRPHAEVQNNTTWHLVRDMEMIRETLGIARWIVFGGSWGATLSLVYAQSVPSKIAYLVLRGVFLARAEELAWFYGGGAAMFWPQQWLAFAGMVPENERSDLIEAYHKRLFSGDLRVETRYAKAWAGWENALASIRSNGRSGETPGTYARAFARLENHYFRHKCFLGPGEQILARADRLKGIAGTIVQGRYDMICPPASAWALAQAWPDVELRMVNLAGHALSEPEITQELVAVMDKLATAGRLP